MENSPDCKTEKRELTAAENQLLAGKSPKAIMADFLDYPGVTEGHLLLLINILQTLKIDVTDPEAWIKSYPDYGDILSNGQGTPQPTDSFWDDFVIPDGWKTAQSKRQEEATASQLLAEIRDLLNNGPRDAQ